MCHDESPSSTEKRFRVNVFVATVDRACGQIKQRFLSLSSLAATFSALLPSTLLDAFDNELYAAAELLAKQYDTLISLSFPAQLFVISLKLSFEVVNEVNHLRNCTIVTVTRRLLCCFV